MNNDNFVGRVLRADMTGFACGTHSGLISQNHDLGVFVSVPIANNDDIHLIGVIYAVDIHDDQLVNELVMSEFVDVNVLRDQRENRMVPVEIRVLHIGYRVGSRFYQSLPPRPPMSLSEVYLCSAEEVFYFSQNLDFFRIILNTAEVPSVDLITNTILYAAQVYEDNDRYHFLVSCGRQLARDLSADLTRLHYILNAIHPSKNYA